MFQIFIKYSEINLFFISHYYSNKNDNIYLFVNYYLTVLCKKQIIIILFLFVRINFDSLIDIWYNIANI